MNRLDELLARLPERLSVEQLADVLGIRPATAYGWLQEGLVPAYKIGRASWLILRDEIRDYLISRSNTPGASPVQPGQEGDPSEATGAEAGPDATADGVDVGAGD